MAEVNLLVHLKAIKASINPKAGICYQLSERRRKHLEAVSAETDEVWDEIYDAWEDAWEELGALFEAWPKRSGSLTYPVPSADSLTCACRAFLDAEETGTLWQGEYGKLRMELLDFCIAQLEGEQRAN